jgi:SAM-dependent methyltransferase
VGPPAGLAARASLANRRRKFRLFMDAITPDERTTVADVGVADADFAAEPGHGYTYNFFEELYPWRERITAVSDVPLPRFAAAFPEIRCVVADGRELPFADGEFDVAFSNAVVEHVGPPEEQRRFVHELCRVAGRVFLTTPNRLFPLEVHTLVPFAHWLPRPAADRIMGLLRRRKDWDAVHLLTPQALLRLFPAGFEARLLDRGVTLVALGERR